MSGSAARSGSIPWRCCWTSPAARCTGWCAPCSRARWRSAPMAETVLGLDLGGAHLKLALARDGQVTVVRQVPCRLWEGLDRLGTAFEAALAGLAPPTRVALTM